MMTQMSWGLTFASQEDAEAAVALLERGGNQIYVEKGQKIFSMQNGLKGGAVQEAVVCVLTDRLTLREPGDGVINRVGRLNSAHSEPSTHPAHQSE
jgi:hypothetical protein